MFDREKLIEAVLHELDSAPGDYHVVRAREERQAARIVDAVLAALPAEPEQEKPVRATDPVRAAAEELLARYDAGWTLAVPGPWRVLRAALAADREPEPVEITDEMVERATEALWTESARLFGGVRYGQLSAPNKRNYQLMALAALAAALSAPPPEGESE